MAKGTPNYSLDEYLLLIDECDSDEELRTIDNLINEDREKSCFRTQEYIDIRMRYTFKKISIEMKKDQED